MKKALFFILLFLLVAAKVSAQETYSGEHIRNFQTEIKINSSAIINVVELIEYDFGPLQRHGIFRNIPFTKKNQKGQKYELIFSEWQVIDQNGEKYKFKKSKVGENIQLKIGDPDEYVTGRKIYIISYIVHGALTYFSDHDELYWNATGNQWTVPIAKSRAVVRFDRGLNDQTIRAACFVGSFGSTNTDCYKNVASGTEVEFRSNKGLAEEEGLTVVVGFPKNVVAVVEPKPYKTFWETWFGKLLGALLLGGLILIVTLWYLVYPVRIIYKWFKHGRDPKVPEGPVTAWFDPPKTSSGRSLTPAEVGALVDETVHQRDISSMIVDLARRGYLKIEERKHKDFYFHKTKDFSLDSSLQEAELDLLKALFDSKKTVRVKDLKIANEVALLKNKIYTNLVKDGYFPTNPQTTRTFYTAMGIIGLATANFPLFVVAITFGRGMPRKTAFGATAANVAKSLRRFLSSQERQLKFQASKQLMFEKLLPYAVAFGVEEIWAERFKDIHLKQPEWYQSYDSRGFNSMNFTRSLNSSFTSVARAATPTSSSTGHSSGFSGGSSGGGGGGGGGGSW